MRVSSCRDGQRIGSRPRPPRARADAATRPAAGGSSPASVRPSVDLPAPFGSGDARAPRRRAPRGRCPTATGDAAHARDGERSRAAAASRPARRGGAGGTAGGMPGTHTPRGGELRAPVAEHGVGRAVGDRRRRRRARSPGRRAAATPRRGARRPRASRRCARARGARRRAPRRPRGVEVRGRLVEQHEPRAHRESAGEREPLLLAARQRLGRAVERHVEPDRVERRAHPRPDLVARNAEVLAAERDVVADPRQDHLACRGPAAPVPARPRAARRRLAVDRAARRSARPRRRRRARRRGRAAASTCPSRRRRAAAPAPPARCGTRHPAPPTRRRDACRHPHPRASTAAGRTRVVAARHALRRAARASRPEANRSSAPVAASPRARSHDSRRRR